MGFQILFSISRPRLPSCMSECAYLYEPFPDNIILHFPAFISTDFHFRSDSVCKILFLSFLFDSGLFTERTDQVCMYMKIQADTNRAAPRIQTLSSYLATHSTNGVAWRLTQESWLSRFCVWQVCIDNPIRYEEIAGSDRSQPGLAAVCTLRSLHRIGRTCARWGRCGRGPRNVNI